MAKEVKSSEEPFGLYIVMKKIHEHWWFYLTDFEYRVLMFIVMRTEAWNKREEGIPVQHFLRGVWINDPPGERVIQPIPGQRGPISKSTVFRTLKSLEQKGLITRRSTGRATRYALKMTGWQAGERLHLDKFAQGQNREKREHLMKNARVLHHETRDILDDDGRPATRIHDIIRTEGGACINRHAVEYLDINAPTEYRYDQCIDFVGRTLAKPDGIIDSYKTSIQNGKKTRFYFPTDINRNAVYWQEGMPPREVSPEKISADGFPDRPNRSRPKMKKCIKSRRIKK